MIPQTYKSFQLDGTENQQALQSEIRDTISSAIGMHSNRMLTNAEIDDISTTDDYKEQLAKIKQVISEKGNTVVDELIPSLIACNMVNLDIEFTSSGASVLI
jgi:hypothetical protein